MSEQIDRSIDELKQDVRSKRRGSTGTKSDDTIGGTDLTWCTV